MTEDPLLTFQDCDLANDHLQAPGQSPQDATFEETQMTYLVQRECAVTKRPDPGFGWGNHFEDIPLAGL